MIAPRKPMVQLTTVWERTSAAGKRYFSGFLGNSQLLIFDDGEHPHPTKPGETVHVWKVLLQERDQAPLPKPTRGEQTWHRARHADKSRAATAAGLDAALADREGRGR
jgi:acyl dehydratase